MRNKTNSKFHINKKAENDTEVVERRRRLNLVRMPNGVWMRRRNNGDGGGGKSAQHGGEGVQSLDSSADDSIYCSISAPPLSTPQKVLVSRDTQTVPPSDLPESAVR